MAFPTPQPASSKTVRPVVYTKGHTKFVLVSMRITADVAGIESRDIHKTVGYSVQSFIDTTVV